MLLMADHSWKARTTLGRILAIESAKELTSGLLMCDASSLETILVVEDDVVLVRMVSSQHLRDCG